MPLKAPVCVLTAVHVLDHSLSPPASTLQPPSVLDIMWSYCSDIQHLMVVGLSQRMCVVPIDTINKCSAAMAAVKCTLNQVV